MNFLKDYFENKKKAVEKESETTDYIDKKKEDFEKQMESLKDIAKKVHNKTKEAHESSKELSKIVDDVVNKIAIATGGKRG
jgi:methyl-accepting chemotaxis protein